MDIDKVDPNRSALPDAPSTGRAKRKWSDTETWKHQVTAALNEHEIMRGDAELQLRDEMDDSKWVDLLATVLDDWSTR